MAFESKREPGKMFGSVYRQRRFDGYSGSAQPGETNENEHAEPKNLSGDKDAPADIVAAHGLAHSVTYNHDHNGGSHKVSAQFEDGHTHSSDHASAKEAIEHGSRLAWNDSAKKREKYPQDGAESEEKGFEAPNLVM